MRSLLISAGIFVCVLAGAFFGMIVRLRLPGHHLSNDSKDAVKVGMALIATMAALVLGLLIASTKSSFDAQNAEVRQIAANLVMLDRILAAYGPGGQEARMTLRGAVRDFVEGSWRRADSRLSVFANPMLTATGFEMVAKIAALPADDDLHRAIREEAVDLIKSVGKTRWQLVSEEGSSIPMPFLAVLVFWLTILFTSFGLFAPKNATVVAAFVVCALSVSGAIFLILELDRPFEGLMRISAEPFRQVLAP